MMLIPMMRMMNITCVTMVTINDDEVMTDDDEEGDHHDG